MSSPAPRLKVSRIRVGFQIFLHFLIVSHVLTYYFLDWRSLGGVDFQDFFHSFMGSGTITEGVLLALAAYAACLVFGRLFCSWGCHFGATQDLAAWLLRRLGWKPPLVITRFLHWSPYLLLGFVFLWPSIERWLAHGWHFTGLELAGGGPWGRLPGLAGSVITFAACGVGILFVLGTRGFCRFVCPYGATFRVGELVAPMRVRRTGSCAGGCGEDAPAPCTAVCPTAIDVHGETEIHGKVTNLDCVRCHLCIEACPSGVLKYGLPAPGFARGKGPAPRPRRSAYTFGLWEELLALAVAVGTFVACDLVYGGHFLAATLAWGEGLLALLVARLLSRREVSLLGWTLRKRERWRLGGITVIGVFLLTLPLIFEAGAFKYHRYRGFELWLSSTREDAPIADGERGVATRVVHGERGDLERAAESLALALRYFPSDLKCRETLCHIYMALRDRRAVAAAEEIARRSQFSRRSLENLRWVYLRFGDVERAAWLEGRLRADANQSRAPAAGR